jgi:GntR family transcriptional regulator, rspAB operon transcriptional repressor
MSLSDQAHRELTRLIVTLELPPESTLDEDELQRRLKIGRTPIREALQRLERDQFVRIVPRRGVFVTKVDPADLSMLFETRSVVEPYAARLAAARGTDADWDEMEAVLQQATTRTDPAALLSIDRACHQIMWRAAQNHYLTDTVEMLYTHSERVWHLFLRKLADMHSAIDEHREVLSALRAKDEAAVAAMIEVHVRTFDREIRAAGLR